MQKVQVITGPYVFTVRAFAAQNFIFAANPGKTLAISHIIRYTVFVCLLYAGNFPCKRED